MKINSTDSTATLRALGWNHKLTCVMYVAKVLDGFPQYGSITQPDPS